MALKKSKYRYTLKCTECSVLVQSQNQYCSFCGLEHGIFVTNQPGISHFHVCAKCEENINSKSLRTSCFVCKSNKLEWWDNKANDWFVTDLSKIYQNSKDTVWLAGDFDGDLIGEVEENRHHEGATHGDRIYTLKINGGVLKNVTKVQNPPLSHQLMERPYPIRQHEVRDVQVKVDEQYAAVSLFDFRLHSWSEFKDDQIEQEKFYARINGKAYGCLNPGPLIVKQPEILNDLPSPNSPLNPEPIANLVEDKKTVLKDAEAPEHSVHDGKDQYSNCKFCSLLWKFLSALALLFFCSFSKALLVFLGTTLVCWFDRYVTSKGLKIKSEQHRKKISIILILVASLVLLYLLYSLEKFGCAQNYSWHLIILFICFLFSSLLIKCTPKTVLFILWIFGLALTCNSDCNINPSHGALSQNASQLFSGNSQISNEVSSASELSNNGKLLSLEEAMQNPEQLKNCNNKLYLPEATLFALNSDKINQGSDANLNQLLILISKLEKDSHLTITGHTDSSGEFLHNIRLSERRASAVASWLTARGANPNLIDVRGVGSKFPLVEGNPLSSYNRRVEINLTCKSGK